MKMERSGVKTEWLTDVLRDYNHADIIEVLGESDLLEAIGVERQLAYCEAVALGPPAPDRQFVRARIAAIFTRMERDR